MKSPNYNELSEATMAVLEKLEEIKKEVLKAYDSDAETMSKACRKLKRLLRTATAEKTEEILPTIEMAEVWLSIERLSDWLWER